MPLHPDPTDLQKCSSCARKPKEGLPQPDGNILEARGMGESSKPARAARRRAGAWLVPGRALLFGQAPPVFFERVRCGGSVSNACADGLAHVLIAPRVSRAGRPERAQSGAPPRQALAASLAAALAPALTPAAVSASGIATAITTNR